jgi:hypothetical protein
VLENKEATVRDYCKLIFELMKTNLGKTKKQKLVGFENIDVTYLRLYKE